jgi:transcriptional regulator with XRE-family HTH domain
MYAAERSRLGGRIRALRQERGLKIRELAEATGVSTSQISQIETGRVDASVVTLRRIATRLQVPIADFFSPTSDGGEPASAPAPAPAVAQEARPLARIVRAGERKRLQIPRSSFVFELLTPDLQGAIEFLWIELDPGHAASPAMPHSRPGEECALVLEGTMHLTVGEEEYVLGPGDSCVFDPSVPHRLENRGSVKLVQVSAIVPPSF